MSDHDHIDMQTAYYETNAAQERYNLALEEKRPFMMLRPRIFPDGDQWCALYGESIQDGVCAFGKTPHEASIAFDIAWLNGKAREA